MACPLRKGKPSNSDIAEKLREEFKKHASQSGPKPDIESSLHCRKVVTNSAYTTQVLRVSESVNRMKLALNAAAAPRTGPTLLGRDAETFPPISELLAEISAGDLSLRIAETEAEINAAQRLRYQVFYEEMSAQPSDAMAAEKRDFDEYDTVVDHLLVIDNSLGGGLESVVGTYRLMRRDGAAKSGGFYTADEFDIDRLTGMHGEILELGRSCVAAPYRSKRVMDMLWRGIAAYVAFYQIKVMFGCASIEGVDPEALALPLSYLHHYHLAPEELRTKAVEDRYVAMDRLAKDSFNPKAGIVSVPPLIKGYIRLGGFVGDGAVIDRQFQTTDVCIIVKTELVTARYVNHYNRG